MEVKALFDKFQKNKKSLKAKVAEVKAQKAEEKAQPAKVTEKAGLKKKASKSSKGPSARDQALRRDFKKTDEGFKIYTEDELRLGDGKVGETPDCPFDCECCF